MIANVSAHRRANAFAQALEEPSAPDAAAEPADAPDTPDTPRAHTSDAPDAPGTPDEQSRMVALASSLSELPRAQLDPEVKVVQRARLVAAMETMLLEGTGPGTDGPAVPEQRARRGKGSHRAPLHKLRPRSRLSKSLAAGGLTVGVAAGAFGGVAAASSDALPGDSLYGLKRGMEDVKLGMADGDSDRGRLYLDQASTRLGEARRLMERGRSGPLDHESVSEVRRVLSGMQHDAEEGHRLLHAAYERDGSLGPIQALSTFSRSHQAGWSELREKLPVQLGDVGDQVTSVFAAMDKEVAPLSSLLPEPPASPTTPRTPGTTEGTTGSPRHHSPTPSATGSSPAAGHHHGSPEPSKSGSEEGGGLLGGGTGGLLDPPSDGTTPSPSGGGRKPPKPEVTLPPLLPGLLPGLGIDAEDHG
ncbi:DUF5667 domain-containing protein [Streptomyces sp. NPDC058045]|uniref:DUF5667 domain-containing protein n=1 Tax=Streptomyces sp. NPDC058045 TaxID=3346311 RepID=UPI0036EBA220